MTDTTIKLVSKYALLLAVFSILEYGLFRYIRQIDPELPREQEFLLMALPSICAIILNAITAAIVFRDIGAQGTSTRYVIIATILYRPIGVVAFLLFSIYENVQHQKEPKME